MHPEQGSAQLELKGELSLSHETIHQHLCAAKLAGGGGLGGENLCTARNRDASTLRSSARVDNWEDNSLIGKHNQRILVTLNLRKFIVYEILSLNIKYAAPIMQRPAHK